MKVNEAALNENLRLKNHFLLSPNNKKNAVLDDTSAIFILIIRSLAKRVNDTLHDYK